MSDFTPRSVELRGGFLVRAPAALAFELFSPLGETQWVPDWSPELLYPFGVVWERGLIFRTRDDRGEAVWVVTALDRDAYEVEYHRVEPGHYVARITVRCAPRSGGETEVQVAYTFVGLSESGNAEIGLMAPDAYAQRMERWRGWIAEYLARVGS